MQKISRTVSRLGLRAASRALSSSIYMVKSATSSSSLAPTRAFIGRANRVAGGARYMSSLPAFTVVPMPSLSPVSLDYCYFAIYIR